MPLIAYGVVYDAKHPSAQSPRAGDPAATFSKEYSNHLKGADACLRRPVRPSPRAAVFSLR